MANHLGDVPYKCNTLMVGKREQRGRLVLCLYRARTPSGPAITYQSQWKFEDWVDSIVEWYFRWVALSPFSAFFLPCIFLAWMKTVCRIFSVACGLFITPVPIGRRLAKSFVSSHQIKAAWEMLHPRVTLTSNYFKNASRYCLTFKTLDKCLTEEAERIPCTNVKEFPS